MSTASLDAPLPRSDVGQVEAYSAAHAAQGIGRTLIEVFAVGPYKYTNLEDAIAQANRDRHLT